MVLCNAVKEDLLRIKPGALCKEIPHPIYAQFGEKLSKESACNLIGANPNLKTLLFFGLIREYKGLDILLRAFNTLGSNYQLVIAGEPYGSFDKYAKLIEESPNRERIILNTNYIKDSEVNRYFSAADLCVLPYRSATQSGISNISFFYNLPLLTTNVGGLKEMIADKGLGVVVNEIEPEAIASAIENYFGNNLHTSICANIEREKERLSWKNFAKELIGFCNSL